ncbi:hypothetical protein IWX49DRAFT_88652 [Phyllosticta citricarpa]
MATTRRDTFCEPEGWGWMKVDYFSYVSLSYLQRDGRLERASGRLWVLSATLSQLSLLLHLPFFSPPPLPPPPLPLPFFFCLPTYLLFGRLFLSFFAAVYLPTYQHTCKTFAARLPLSLSLSLSPPYVTAFFLPIRLFVYFSVSLSAWLVCRAPNRRACIRLDSSSDFFFLLLRRCSESNVLSLVSRLLFQSATANCKLQHHRILATGGKEKRKKKDE